MNWGTKLAVGMTLFIVFIVGMAFYMFSKQGDDALVEDNYYEHGVNYNGDVQARQNVLNDKVAPTIQISASQLILQLKDSASYQLKLLRPSAAKEDRSQKGSTLGDAHLIVVERENMPDGLWQLELRWRHHNRDYLYQKEIRL